MEPKLITVRNMPTVHVPQHLKMFLVMVKDLRDTYIKHFLVALFAVVADISSLFSVASGCQFCHRRCQGNQLSI